MSLLVNYENSDGEDSDDDSSFDAVAQQKNVDVTSKVSSTISTGDTRNTNSGALHLPEPKMQEMNEVADYSRNGLKGDKVNISNDRVASTEIFRKLPAPAHKFDSTDNTTEMIILPTAAELKLRELPPARTKRKIIISLPYVDNSDSDDEITAEPEPKKQHHGSSLFALLPEPSMTTHTQRKLNSALDVDTEATSINAGLKPMVTTTTTTTLKPRTLIKPATTTTTVVRTATTTTTAVNTDDTSITASTAATSDITTTSRLLQSDAGKTESVSTMPKNPNFLGLVGSYDDDEDDNFSDVDNNNIDNLGEYGIKKMDGSVNSKSIDDITDDRPTIGPQRSYFIDDDDDDDDDNNADDNNSSKAIHSSALYNYDNVVAASDYYMQEQDGDDNDGGNINDVTSILTKEQLERLQGRPNKKQESSISLIDVNLSDHIGQYELGRTKNLTIDADMMSHSKKADGMPTSQQKRKHQITYLAHQAKEREFELKNQWAENRFSRRQTQSKYGF